MYALRLCTQNNQVLCVELPQYKHSIHKEGRGSEARETNEKTECEWREREGTHNRLAAPVLMLRPAGPLADLAKAIVDRGAASLLS